MSTFFDIPSETARRIWLTFLRLYAIILLTSIGIQEDAILLKNYKFGFDVLGVIIFLMIMIPNFIWFAVPAQNDILRKESVTALIDTIASVCQVLFLISLCIIINKDRNKLRLSPLLLSSILCICLYYLAWVFYYIGIVHPIVILSLTLPPCFAFVFFAFDRKNMIAVIPAICFTICHCIYGLVNYIISA